MSDATRTLAVRLEDGTEVWTGVDPELGLITAEVHRPGRPVAVRVLDAEQGRQLAADILAAADTAELMGGTVRLRFLENW